MLIPGNSSASKENSHYRHRCQNAETMEKWAAATGTAQKLAFPIQLLWTKKWGLKLHEEVLAEREKWFIETIQVSDDSEDRLIAALQLKGE